MILRHYSDQPIALDFSQTYSQDTRERFWHKPHGLWLSVVGDSDWKEWCEAEDFNLAGLAHSVDFELTDDANILTITTVGELRAFTRRYCTGGRYMQEVDWTRVKAEYGGILIAPYQWQCRLADDTFWYYSWDCASACVWDLSVVQLATNKEVTK